MTKWLYKIQAALKPERMYKISLVLAFFDLFLALGCLYIGLPAECAQIFLASTACFIVAGFGNWWIMRSQNN
jgi:hypothetical protein